jgi:hypothetical protein
MNTEEYVPIP